MARGDEKREIACEIVELMRFRYSLENLRGLAIIFVMFSHFGSLIALGGIGKVFYFLVIDATSWFVFLSGYLFYHIEGERFRYSSYLMKKIKFVFLPYLILSIPAIFAGLYLGQEKLIGISKSAYISWSLVAGGYVVGPMWFIPMILIFFILSPVFNYAAKSRLIYFLASATILLSLFSVRTVGNFNPFLSFMHFLGFYLLGIVFALNVALTDKIKSSGTTWIVAMLCLSVFVLAMYRFQELPKTYLGFYEGLGLLNLKQLGKLSLLIALFVLFDKFFDRKNRFLGYFAEISFGLFFIHGFFLTFFTRIGYSFIPPYPVLMFFSEFLTVIMFSLVTVYAIKQVSGKWSRYVIGC